VRPVRHSFLILPREGGRWSPRRHHPLHHPLIVVSADFGKPRIDGLPFTADRSLAALGLVRSGRETEAAKMLKDALALPTEARAALAGALLECLGTEVDEGRRSHVCDGGEPPRGRAR